MIVSILILSPILMFDFLTLPTAVVMYRHMVATLDVAMLVYDYTDVMASKKLCSVIRTAVAHIHSLAFAAHLNIPTIQVKTSGVN